MNRRFTVSIAACILLLAQYLLGMAVNGHGFSSFIMAALWALATACYVTAAVLAARRA